MKITTICENKVYSRAYKKGKKHAGKYSVIYALKNNAGEVRIGLTVTKARGTAVVRSRIKRVLRHAYYAVAKKYEIPVGYDFIIVARDACAFAKSDKAALDMERSMISLGIIGPENIVREAQKIAVSEQIADNLAESTPVL